MNLFESMRVFAGIVEKGSLSAAGSALNMSPTMVGKHLRGLEHHLKTQLLHRTTRRQSLTAVGAVYYEHCKNVLALVTEGEQQVLEQQRLPSGLLRLSAPEILGQYALMPFIQHYLKQYPNTSIDLTLTDHLSDIHGEDFDAVVRIGRLPDRADIIAQPLSPYTLVFCASPDYLQRSGIPETPEDLVHHECLSISERALAEWWPKREHGGRFINARFGSNSTIALTKAVLDDMGIALLPEILVKEHIRCGRLVRLFSDRPLPCREVNVIYPWQRYKTAKLECFIRSLREAFPISGAGS